MPPYSPDKLTSMRQDAIAIFNAALSAVRADTLIQTTCRLDHNRLIIDESVFDLNQFEHIHIIGAGKATAYMAAAMEQLLGGKITSGIISVKYDHTQPLEYIHTIEAAHPIPDNNGQIAAAQILQLAGSAGQKDLIICLLSGGGSALLPLPAGGITLAEKQETIRQLLACGATIHEINALRKHLSTIKGGNLARAAHPATLITLMISDVIGDSADAIASGPTVADTSNFTDCWEVIQKYGLTDRLPKSVAIHIENGREGLITDTPKPGDPTIEQTHPYIIGSNFAALRAAEKLARSLGYHSLILSSMIEGEAKEAAVFHAAIAKELHKSSNPLNLPACILSGGETTVRVTGKGLGGRNQEFALAAATKIDGVGNIVILSGGTDGTDGPTDAAGAVVDSMTIQNAVGRGLISEKYLGANDTYHFFQQTDDLLITGPTGTNVMDLYIILVSAV